MPMRFGDYGNNIYDNYFCTSLGHQLETSDSALRWRYNLSAADLHLVSLVNAYTP